MSISLLAGELIPFTPTGAEDELPKPVYHVRSPSVYDRARYSRELVAKGVSYPTEREFRREMRVSIKKYVAEDQVEAALAIVDADEKGEPSDIRELEGQIRAISPEYSRLLANRAYYSQIAPILAVQMFLVKADHVPQLTRKDSMLTEESLEHIPHAHLEELGGFIQGLMMLTHEQRKNLAAPSGSLHDQKNMQTKTATDGRSTNGKSKVKSTRKTRA